MGDAPSMLRQALVDSLDDQTLKILSERIEAFIQHWGKKPTPEQIRDFFRRE